MVRCNSKSGLVLSWAGGKDFDFDFVSVIIDTDTAARLLNAQSNQSKEAMPT